MQSPALKEPLRGTTTYAIPAPSKSGLPTTQVYSSKHDGVTITRLASALWQNHLINKNVRYGSSSYCLAWHILYKSPLLFSNNCCRNRATLFCFHRGHDRASGFTTRGN